MKSRVNVVARRVTAKWHGETKINRRSGVGFALWAVLSVAVSVSPAAGQAATEAQFVDWVKQTAVPFERWAMNPALATSLETAMGDRRIVFIGEPGHFFSEKYDVQLMLIEHLAQQGYRHLFIEGLGAAASEIVDDFVRSPVDSAARDVGSDRFERYRERVLSLNAQAQTAEFPRRHSAAQHAFFCALQQLSTELSETGEPLTIHPLDIDMKPGGCILTIATLLERYPDEADLLKFGASCDRQEDEAMSAWIVRLEELRRRAQINDAGLLDALSDDDRARLGQCVDCLVESLVFMETRAADGNMNRALVRREPAMYRQVAAALAELPDDARVIMMAHTNHLCREGADTTRARQPSVGEMIQQAFPDDVFSVWMLHDHGQLLNPMAAEVLEDLPSDPERVESLMIQAGRTYLLPLHTGAAGERYLDEKRRFSYFSWFETATLTRQTDALIFIDEITALPALAAGPE